MNDTFLILFSAWAALVAAAISPGPNMVAVASRGLGAGQAPALMVAFGIAIGGFFWAILTGIGLGTLFQTHPILLRILGFLGGLYLLWLGFKGWRAAISGAQSNIEAKASKGFGHDACYGLIITATNPKVALLWASLSTFVASATVSYKMLLLFAGMSSIILFVIYGAYGVLFSLGGVRKLYRRFQTASEAIFGTIFSIVGIGMIIRAARGG